MVKRSSGYTLLEIVITLAVFGFFLMMIVSLTAEMRANEKRYPVNFMAHPEMSGVMARMRKDIYDTMSYTAEWQGYAQTHQTLILYTLTEGGGAETVVWDFRTPAEVHRKAWVATELRTDWVARGLPNFSVDIDTYRLPTGQDAVRIQATDDQHRLAIDEIFVPRKHS